MTVFPWKIIRNGQEIYFPEGARRFVSVSVEQIGGDGRLDRAIDASAIFLGDAAFRLHAVTLSCQGHTVAPVFDVWPGQQVTLECPVEFAVPGPSAVLAYDPVAGSVYGVDEDDNRLAATVVGRNVTSAGAVAIRFRPVMQCVVASRNADKTQNRADAGWTIRLEETGGTISGVDDEGDTISFTSPGLRTFTPGTAMSFGLAANVTTNTGLPVSYSIVSGTLPAGLTLNAATGLVSGTPTAFGLSVVVFRATSGTVSATQTIPFNAPAPVVTFAPVAAQTHLPGTAFSLNLAASVSVQNSTAPVTYSIVSGTLPAGLTLNAATGVISGTPTEAGSFSVVVRASIPGGFSDDQRVSFNAALPTIASNGLTLQNYTVGTAFSLNLATLVTTANTTETPTFAVDLGSLPAGLSMNSAGLISGTPTAYGAFAFSARATLPTGQWTEVSVAFFAQNPDELPDAVILGGTAQTWLESGANGSTTYDAQDFTASGVLTVLSAGWLEYILVGGGAGGASVSSTAGGGGGGAGAFRRERIYLPAGTYNVSIGGGGGPGVNGAGTSFTDGLYLTRSVGGGLRGGSTSAAGLSGSFASAGGGGGSSTAGGAGGTTTTPEYGSNGGAGNTNATAASQNGGGGGGFSEAGLAASNGRGHGGGGIKVKLWDVLIFCGGGGGGAGNGGSNNGAGGSGVGGNGGGSNAAGAAGVANTGSGGGGAGGGPSGSRTGGAGGSGRAIFIVRRRTA